jgi:catechol 2,3-dioxygenase-like lactoylglutathione lyase family enzyme
MNIEWEPDAENVYLTSGGLDNLALHKAPSSADAPQRLDHLGFALPTLESVDEWYRFVSAQGAKIVRDIKTHRDGARSFYMADLDGNIIQMIYHPPIAKRAHGTDLEL